MEQTFEKGENIKETEIVNLKNFTVYIVFFIFIVLTFEICKVILTTFMNKKD